MNLIHKKGYLFLAFAALVLIVSFTLSSCGGGGGGAAAPVGSTTLATGTFVKTPSSVDNGGGGLFDVDTYAHWQSLYTATTISGSGNITGISFRYGTTLASTVTCTNTTIKLGHSVLLATDLTTTFASNVSNGAGGQTTVMSNGTITFPAGLANTWHTVSFTTPFAYNGVDNLVVDITRAACSGKALETVEMPTSYNASVYEYSAAATGTPAAWVQNARFTFAGGDNIQSGSGAIIGDATIFSTVSPLRVQNLYLASDINGSGPITGIAYQMNSLNAVPAVITYSLKLSHTIVTALSETFANNPSGTQTAVASAVTVTLPTWMQPGDWFWLPIPHGTFTYNGTDNLLVDLTILSADATLTIRSSSKAGARVKAAGAAPVIGAVSVELPNIKLRFNGGRLLVMNPAYAATTGRVLGNGGARQIQSLYENSDLGTGGTINNIYVRMATVSTTTLTNYKVYMGLTTKSSYTTIDTYASNMTGSVMVFSGALPIPAGMVAGDWLKIPLSTAFVYDSTKNLSILFTTDAGPAGNDVIVDWDNMRFGSSSVFRNDNAVGTSGNPTGVFDAIPELAVDITK